jgi:hypothetical protein
MASILDGLKADITAAFDGTLRDGALYRPGDLVDPYGNVTPGAGPVEFFGTFQGLRANYDAAWIQAGIPRTAAKIEILAASLSTTPVQGDVLEVESAWWLVTTVEVDPSGAWYACECRATSAP